LILILALFALALTGCHKWYKSDYALMIGVTTSQAGAEVSHTVAAIVIDKDYRIVSCRIDAIAVTAELTDGKINEEKTYESKVELGDRYGMLTNSPYFGSSLAEWDDQVKAFENYVVGKTREEVKRITDADGKVTDETLTAGCTIGVSDFMKAIDNAFESGHMVGLQTKGNITLGVSASADVTNKNGGASYTADFAAVAIVDGTVLAAVIDSKEVTCKIEADGSFGKIADKGTKLEQGDGYNMVAYGGAIAEWYEQAQAYADSAVGKSVSEIPALKTEGVAGCTIYAGGYKKALEKAASYAR
jgi:hypothetical protein